MARPRKVPRKEPAMPMSIVIQMPPGSFPGMMSLAMAPTTSPMIAVHNKENIRVPPDVVWQGGPVQSRGLEKDTPCEEEYEGLVVFRYTNLAAREDPSPCKPLFWI